MSTTYQGIFRYLDEKATDGQRREVVRACLRELDEEDDLDRIYLGPEGSDAEHGTNARLWCQDRVWGGEGIEYVRVGRLLPETEGEA